MGVPVPVRRRTSYINSTEVDNRDEFISTSRYKNTKYYRRTIPNIGQVIEPETWVPPEIPKTANDLYTKVKPGEEGRLDLIAFRVYRLEGLWWVIAFMNDIIDPFEEVTVNRELRYPPFETVATQVLS